MRQAKVYIQLLKYMYLEGQGDLVSRLIRGKMVLLYGLQGLSTYLLSLPDPPSRMMKHGSSKLHISCECFSWPQVVSPYNSNWKFPKIRGIHFRGPHNKALVIVFGGLYWGPPILGNY